MNAATTDPADLLRLLQDLRIGLEIVTERIAKASQLNPRDLGVLDVLHAEGPSTPKAIADLTGIHPTTLTAVLARLERDGRVDRARNPTDARSSLVSITAETVRELTRLYAGINGDLMRRFAELSPNERAVIQCFLQDLVTTLHVAPASSHRRRR